MKTTINLLITLVLFLTIGCNGPKSRIKKDLKSRYTGFEIVEIKKDSSNIKTAWWSIGALKIRTSEANLKIIRGIRDIEEGTGTKTKLQTYLSIDSIYKEMLNDLEAFEKTRFNKPDPCYYVKYLVYKNELKVPYEEYYYINEQNKDVLHRPYDWNKFLIQEGYDELIKEATQFTRDLMELRYKYTGKY